MSEGFTQITLWCSSASSCLASWMLYRVSGFCRPTCRHKGQREQKMAKGERTPESEGIKVRGHRDQRGPTGQRALRSEGRTQREVAAPKVGLQTLQEHPYLIIVPVNQT